MDLDNLVPQGGGSLSRPVFGPHGQVVATFSAPQTPDPAALWEPHKTTDATRGGSQGNPFGRPGGIEHEPLDNSEKASGHLVQNVASHVQAAGDIRSALRPGSIAG
jgi:hypothetical protein